MSHAHVWITGASTGIGAALVAPFVATGARVAISARRGDLLDQVAAPHGDRVVAIPCDVTVAASVEAAAREILARFGGLDLVVLNAGRSAPVRVGAFSAQPYRDVFDLNYFGVLDTIAAVLPTLQAQRSGHLAVIASASAFAPVPTMSAYGASKAAIAYTMEALRSELAPWGIDVSVVYPGFVRTPMTAANKRMPFLLEVDDAARRIVDGLARRRPDIDFPRRLTWLLKLVQRLPGGARRAVSRRIVPTRGVLPE